MREMSNSDLTLILSSENEGTLAGLGIATAAIFLAGEMAGSGVLALAYSVVQIGSYFEFRNNCRFVLIQQWFEIWIST